MKFLKKTKNTLLLTLLGFVSSVIMMVFIIKLVGRDQINFNYDANDSLIPYSIFLLIKSLIAPIFEEVGFRLPINSKKRNYIFSALAILALFLLAYLGFEQFNWILIIVFLFSITNFFFHIQLPKEQSCNHICHTLCIKS